MVFENKKVSDIKIAYIGGGSRGWAWNLMSDLAICDDISGSVYLYDIDLQAAKNNEIIGNKYNSEENTKSQWSYKAVETIGEALTDANFVIISILPGTFDEMESDVHAPEKYGIYQAVGDTVGPGGIVRALRTMPMMEEIALAVKEYCPTAWVINYTNPMSVCVAALYNAFPQIKAFGCCHEVFSVQTLLGTVLHDSLGIDKPDRTQIKTNIVGINHFTWITEAKYNDIDIFPIYKEFCKKYSETGFVTHDRSDPNRTDRCFLCEHMVKMDLFNRFGYIAAAGDRHLAEFCPGSWYLKNPDMVEYDWHFGLTPVSWRKNDLQVRLNKSAALISGAQPLAVKSSGEEGTLQIRALLGLGDLVTNVNLPNVGQIPNLPLGAIVETNAAFRSDSISPISAGEVPETIYPLISRICGEQQLVAKAGATKSLEPAFQAFVMDNLVTTTFKDSEKLFDEMIANTAEYLTMYNK